MRELQDKALKFLYKWVNEGKIPNLRKGMTEDLEALISAIVADIEANKSADRMKAKADAEEASKNEGNS